MCTRGALGPRDSWTLLTRGTTCAPANGHRLVTDSAVPAEDEVRAVIHSLVNCFVTGL